MKVKIICDTQNFIVSSDKSSFGEFTISSDFELFKSSFLTPTFQSFVGLLAIQRFRKSCFFLMDTGFKDTVNSLEELASVMHNNNIYYQNEIFNFIVCLWFIKDNNINIHGIYTYLPERDGVYYRTSPFRFVKADFTDEPTEFNLTELKTAYQIYLKWEEISSPAHKTFFNEKNQSSQTVFKRNPTFFNHENSNRIERAFTFLILARTSIYYSERIAQYMCMYEALFSGIEKGEIAHQISERTSKYIGGNNKERLLTYSLIKKAYNIRSTFLHGQTNKYKPEQMKEVCLDIDSLTRKIFLKIIMDDSDIFLQSDQLLENSFKDLVLTDGEPLEKEDEKFSYKRFSKRQ